jgi:hypothetical protein
MDPKWSAWVGAIMTEANPSMKTLFACFWICFMTACADTVSYNPVDAAIDVVTDVRSDTATEVAPDSTQDVSHDTADSTTICASCGAPRPVFPSGMSRVTSLRPTLHWALAGGTDGALIELCRDRACSRPLYQFEARGTEGRVPTALPHGVVFWRMRGMRAGSIGTSFSPSWYFRVNRRDTPVDTAWGIPFDVNGDGYADLGLLAPARATLDLFYGGPDGFSETPSTSIPMNLPFEAPMRDVHYQLARSVGDINGDGYGDLLVRFRFQDVTHDPTVWYLVSIYLGSVEGLTTSSPWMLNPPISATGRLDFFGGKMDGLGDLNRDGYADIGVSYFDESNGRYVVSVYRGRPTELGREPDFRIESPPDMHYSSSAPFGDSMAAADFNGDTYGDIAVSYPIFNKGSADRVRLAGSGRVFLYHGSTTGVVPAESPSLNFDPMWGRFGNSVFEMGDLNGDGYADVGATATVPISYDFRGALYWGTPRGVNPDPARIFRSPTVLNSQAGRLGGMGDLNGDGFIEMASLSMVGDLVRANVFMGSPTGVSELPSQSFDETTQNSSFGAYLLGGRDINGDGYDDLLISEKENGSPRLAATIVYGSARWPAFTMLHVRATILSTPDSLDVYSVLF